MRDNNNKFYGQNEAAQILGVTRQTMWVLVKNLSLTVIWKRRRKLLSCNEIHHLATLGVDYSWRHITPEIYWEGR